VLVQEFLEQFDPGQAPPVVLFCPGAGKGRNPTFEPVLAQRAAAAIADAFVESSLRDFAYALFYADETDAGAVVLEAQTLPFLAPRRVVEVRNAEAYETESRGKALHAYLADPNDATVMVLIASEVDRRLKFFKACQRVGAIIECPELEKRQLEAEVHTELRKRHKEIARDAVDELLQRAGSRLGDVQNAVEVVADFVGGKERIALSDVVDACADIAEEAVWALTDAIATSQMGAAVAHLRRLLSFGKHPDEIMGTLNWLLKSAYAVLTPDGGAKLTPFLAKKVKPLAEKLGCAKMRDAFALCTETQFMMRSTGVDPELALELLVIKLSAPGRAAKRAARAKPEGR